MINKIKEYVMSFATNIIKLNGLDRRNVVYKNKNELFELGIINIFFLSL